MLNDIVPQIVPTTPWESLPEWLTPDEVRAYLRLSRTTVYALIHQKEIAASRFGRRFMVHRDELRPPERRSA